MVMEMLKREIWPILIAGGRGTRFWPLSRKKKPKPLLCLGSDQPMICQACSLLKPISQLKTTFIATSQELASELKKILPHFPEENFLLEPEPRDTAPAIGLSLALISRLLNPSQPEPVLAFLPSDSHFQKPALFLKTLKNAGKLASLHDLIVTIGVKPDTPNPAYGYIQPGRKIPGIPNAYLVKRFKEKPSLAKAREYLRQGFFWNTGMFIARPSVLWRAFEQHQPDFFVRLKKISQAPQAKLNSLIKREFPKFKKISFDYAIMEKIQEVAVVSGDFGFCDLGSFQALDRLLGKKPVKNLGSAPLVSIQSDQLLVQTQKLTAVLGAKNLVIIETEDAILVMERSAEKWLKELVRKLERLGLKQYL